MAEAQADSKRPRKMHRLPKGYITQQPLNCSETSSQRPTRVQGGKATTIAPSDRVTLRQRLDAKSRLRLDQNTLHVCCQARPKTARPSRKTPIPVRRGPSVEEAVAVFEQRQRQGQRH